MSKKEKSIETHMINLKREIKSVLPSIQNIEARQDIQFLLEKVDTGLLEKNSEILVLQNENQELKLRNLNNEAVIQDLKESLSLRPKKIDELNEALGFINLFTYANPASAGNLKEKALELKSKILNKIKELESIK